MLFTLDLTLTEGADPDQVADAILDTLCDLPALPGVFSVDSCEAETWREPHTLTISDEADGFRRATCSCMASQASPRRDLTEQQAQAWHGMHVTNAGKVAPR